MSTIGGVLSQIEALQTDVNNLQGVGNSLVNIDLNDVKETGSYFCYSDATATTTSHYPASGEGGILVVEGTKSGSTFVYVKQTYTTRSNSHQYVRIYQSHNTSWSSWHTVW